MSPIRRGLALMALAFLAVQAQTWQKIYPSDATPRDAAIMGWDSQGRLFLWDNAAATGRGVYYLEGGVWKHETLDANLALVTFLSFAVAPNGTLYALANVAAPASAGVYRSTNLGATWTLVHAKLDGNLNSPPPAVRSSGDLYFYGRTSVSTSVNGWLHHSANTGTAWDSMAAAEIRVCKQMAVAPDGKLVMVCNGASNVNYRPWVSGTTGTAFTAFRTTSGGVGGGCEYSLSADISGTVLVGCSNGTVGMALNGTDTLLLSAINGAGGEVTGVTARSSTEFLAAANNNGVYRSTNSGTSWVRAGAGMTGNDSAFVRSLRRGPDGRSYAATSGFLYAYGTATTIGDKREGFRAEPKIHNAGGGWVITGTSIGGRIIIRSTDGRTLRVVTTSAGETLIPERGLPRTVLIAEITGENRLVKLPPR